MRFYFQVIILGFSSHHKTGNTRNYGCIDAPSQQQLCVAHQQSKIDYLEYPPTSLACKSDMVGIMQVLTNCKNGHFGVKLIILCDSFFNFIFVDIREWMINNVGKCFLGTMKSMETPGSESFPKGKQTKNSLPNMSLMSQHSIVSNLLSSFLTTSFVKIFLSFQLVFSPFFLSFCWARATTPLKVCECLV
jgi:hypothetical protein